MNALRSSVVVVVFLGLHSLALAQDKTVTISTSDQKRSITAKDKVISIIDNDTQRLLIRIQGHREAITALAITPDGKLLASGSQDKTVALWDLATGKQLRIINLGATPLQLSFSADGRRLQADDSNQQKRTWDLPSGQEVK